MIAYTLQKRSYTYFMTYSSGFVIIIPDKTTIRCKLAPDGHLTDPVCTGHPACVGDPAYIRDPASIRTNCPDPRLVLGTRLLFETQLVLEVLLYAIYTSCRVYK